MIMSEPEARRPKRRERTQQRALARHPSLIVARDFLDGGVIKTLAVLGRGLAGVRTDATVREGAAIILGIGERAVGRDARLELRAVHGLGIFVPGERHFRGGGVAAFAAGIEF